MLCFSTTLHLASVQELKATRSNNNNTRVQSTKVHFILIVFWNLVTSPISIMNLCSKHRKCHIVMYDCWAITVVLLKSILPQVRIHQHRRTRLVLTTAELRALEGQRQEQSSYIYSKTDWNPQHFKFVVIFVIIMTSSLTGHSLSDLARTSPFPSCSAPVHHKVVECVEFIALFTVHPLLHPSPPDQHHYQVRGQHGCNWTHIRSRWGQLQRRDPETVHVVLHI